VSGTDPLDPMNKPERQEIKRYAVRISPRANRESLLLYARLDEVTGDEEAARQWYIGLQEQIGTLSTLPHRYPLRSDESKKIGQDVRRFLYRRPPGGAGYHVYYSVHEDSPDGPHINVWHVRPATARPLTAREGKEIARED
jgi:hypothetical protein